MPPLLTKRSALVSVGTRLTLKKIRNAWTKSTLNSLNLERRKKNVDIWLHVRLMGFDFYQIYIQTLERYFRFKRDALRMQGNRENNEALKADAKSYDEVINNWKPNNFL